MRQNASSQYYVKQNQLLMGVILAGLTYLYFFLTGYKFVPGGFAALDFLEYYGGLNCLDKGLNPYLPENQTLIQSSLGWDGSFPIMMWNPPWLVIVLKPILIFDFPSSALLWLTTQVFFIVVSCFLVSNCFRENIGPILPLALLLIVPVPFLRSLEGGQIGGFLCFFTALTFAALTRKDWFVAGIALSFCSVKPHLVLIAVAMLILWAIRNRILNFIWGLAAGFFFQVILCLLFYGISPFIWWIESFKPNVSGVPTVASWVGVTAPQLVRFYFHSDFSVVILFLAVIVGLVMPGFFRISRKQIDWQIFFPPVIGISVLMALYGWLADFLMLLPLIGAFVFQSNANKFYLAIAVFSSIASVAAYYLWPVYEHSFGLWAIVFCLLSLFHFYESGRRTQVDFG